MDEDHTSRNRGFRIKLATFLALAGVFASSLLLAGCHSNILPRKEDKKAKEKTRHETPERRKK